MPKYWYDRTENRILGNLSDDEISKREFNLRILADKKPYFMRYIYPNLMSQYNTYIKNSDKKCIREFRKTIDELMEQQESDRSAEENEFLAYYFYRMPVGMHDCVMNKICIRFEKEFDNYLMKNNSDEDFDYNIMKSGQEYSTTQYNTISKLYEQYTKRLQEYMQFVKRERVDDDESATRRSLMIREFKVECEKACSNSAQLCDIILDICYQRSGSKQFCWDICNDDIINNLLQNNGNVIHFPVQNESGDIRFGGKRFSFESKEVSK